MSAASDPTPPEPAPPLPPRRPSLWRRYRAAVLTVVLVVYTLVLAGVIADDVLRLGVFPTRYEQMARDLIERFDAADPAEAQAAVDEFVRDIDAFVAVPQLLRALGSDSERRRALAADALRRITDARHGYEAEAPPPERDAARKRWSLWWKANRYRF